MAIQSSEKPNEADKMKVRMTKERVKILGISLLISL
jgi:hypothetical protein